MGAGRCCGAAPLVGASPGAPAPAETAVDWPLDALQQWSEKTSPQASDLKVCGKPLYAVQQALGLVCSRSITARLGRRRRAAAAARGPPRQSGAPGCVLSLHRATRVTSTSPRRLQGSRAPTSEQRDPHRGGCNECRYALINNLVDVAANQGQYAERRGRLREVTPRPTKLSASVRLGAIAGATQQRCKCEGRRRPREASRRVWAPRWQLETILRSVHGAISESLRTTASASIYHGAAGDQLDWTGPPVAAPAAAGEPPALRSGPRQIARVDHANLFCVSEAALPSSAGSRTRCAGRRPPGSHPAPPPLRQTRPLLLGSAHGKEGEGERGDQRHVLGWVRSEAGVGCRTDGRGQ